MISLTTGMIYNQYFKKQGDLKFMNLPLQQFCENANISLHDLEQNLKSFKDTSGISPLVAAASLEYLILKFSDYNYKIPYAFGGCHNRTLSFPKVFSEDETFEFESGKINRFLGSPNDTVHPDGTEYPFYGPDGSGLVILMLSLMDISYDGNTDIMKNGSSEKNILPLGNNFPLSENNIPERGHVIFTRSIPRIVVDVNDKILTVAESLGGKFGVLLKNYSIAELLEKYPDTCYSDMSIIFKTV